MIRAEIAKRHEGSSKFDRRRRIERLVDGLRGHYLSVQRFYQYTLKTIDGRCGNVSSCLSLTLRGGGGRSRRALPLSLRLGHERKLHEKQDKCSGGKVTKQVWTCDSALHSLQPVCAPALSDEE